MTATVLVAVPAHLRRQFFDAESERSLSAAAAGLGGELDVVEHIAERGESRDVRVIVTAWGCPRLEGDLLEAFPQLRLVAHTGSSVKAIVSDELFARGISVTQAGAAMARPVAEVSLAFTLALLHRINRFDHALRSGTDWETAEEAPTQHELGDAPVGVVGASRTGRAYIALLRAVGARVHIADPTLTVAEASILGATLMPLDELLAMSAVTALHAPSLASTRHLIGARELALLPDGAGLVNTARSWLVDEDALVAELKTGRIDAALDVFDDEPLLASHQLRTLPNVLLTPHKAAGTHEGRLRQGRIVAREVARFHEKLPLAHTVSHDDLRRMA